VCLCVVEDGLGRLLSTGAKRVDSEYSDVKCVRLGQAAWPKHRAKREGAKISPRSDLAMFFFA